MPEQSKIIATSQQSRFHTETLDTSIEVDLKDVTISIGDRELIVGSRLKLKEGVRYALVGRCVSRAAFYNLALIGCNGTETGPGSRVCGGTAIDSSSIDSPHYIQPFWKP